MTPEQRDTFEAYLDVATTGSGAIMLRDLRQSFIELNDPALIDELSEIPHPFRAYVEQGMRMCVQKMEGVIALAEQYRLTGYPPEETEGDETQL